MFDSPHVKVPVGKQTRRRLDAKSIVQLLQSFDAPNGILKFFGTLEGFLFLSFITQHFLHFTHLAGSASWYFIYDLTL